MKTNNLTWAVLAIALILVPFAGAVEPVNPAVVDAAYRYGAYYTATQSGTALVSTLQSPTGAAKRTFMEAVTIESSVACDFTVESAGTAATTTLGSTYTLNTSVVSPTLNYTASNVGVGTTLSQVSLTAGDVRTVVLSGVVLASGVGTTHNVSVRPSCTTGIVKYTWKYAHLKP